MALNINILLIAGDFFRWLKALAKYSGLEILEVYTEWDDNNYSDGSEVWKDSILIARKPDFNLRQALKMYLKNFIKSIS